MNTETQQPAAPFNPLQSWADLHLRMLDWMVSSSQQAGEQADRLARSGQWQAAGWEWVAQAWQQWFELLGAYARTPVPAASEAAAVAAASASRPRARARGTST